MCVWVCQLFLGSLQTGSRLCKLRSAVKAFLSDRDWAPLGWRSSLKLRSEPVILKFLQRVYTGFQTRSAPDCLRPTVTHTYLACRVMWPGGVGLHRSHWFTWARLGLQSFLHSKHIHKITLTIHCHRTTLVLVHLLWGNKEKCSIHCPFLDLCFTFWPLKLLNLENMQIRTLNQFMLLC